MMDEANNKVREASHQGSERGSLRRSTAPKRASSWTVMEIIGFIESQDRAIVFESLMMIRSTQELRAFQYACTLMRDMYDG